MRDCSSTLDEIDRLFRRRYGFPSPTSDVPSHVLSLFQNRDKGNQSDRATPDKKQGSHADPPGGLRLSRSQLPEDVLLDAEVFGSNGGGHFGLVNLFGGFSFGLFPGLSLLLDYSASLDDDDSDVPTHRTRGRGYLDSGVRFEYMDRLRLKVLFKDLLGNYIPENGVARSIEIFYVNYF